MASTYSPNLRIELIGTGDQAGTWGTTTDNTEAYLLESAIAGYQVVPIAPTSNNQVLTYINGASTTPSVNQSVYAALKLTASAVAANFNLFAPPASKTYIINNQSGYQCTLYNSSTIGNTTPAGTGVAIPNGATVAVYSDGTNFFDHSNYAINNFSIGGNALVNGTLTIEGASTFVGIPSGPTAAFGTNTSQLATTAFVQTAAGNLGTMSTQNANSVAITGGNINGVSGTNAGLNVGYATSAGNSATTSQTSFSNLTIGSSQVLDAANYNSYAPTLTGGNASGTWNININGNSATTSQTSFSNLTIGGNQVLDAANYNSYAPTLGGTGASGTWGINITGNAATVSNGVYNNGGTYGINITGSAGYATNAGFATNAGNQGIFGQVFTSSGTFTVPTGVTSLKVTIIGGGGGGGSAYQGGGTVTGGTGGTSSFGGYLSATGGTGGAGSNGNPLYGASGTNGTGGGSSFNSALAPLAYGGGAGAGGQQYGYCGCSGGNVLVAQGGSGGNGGVATGYISVSQGNIIAVTIGSGGTGAAYGTHGQSGSAGYCLVEW